jgi:hypothetical protein
MLIEEISKVRYRKLGEILFDFRGKTYSASEPKDVMPAHDVYVTNDYASRAWALRQLLDDKVIEIKGNELKQIGDELFNLLLKEIIDDFCGTAPTLILRIPGVYKILAEYFHNDIISAWEEENKEE